MFKYQRIDSEVRLIVQLERYLANQYYDKTLDESLKTFYSNWHSRLSRYTQPFYYISEYKELGEGMDQLVVDRFIREESVMFNRRASIVSSKNSTN